MAINAMWPAPLISSMSLSPGLRGSVKYMAKVPSTWSPFEQMSGNDHAARSP